MGTPYEILDLSKEESLKIAESNWWVDCDDRTVTGFQLFTDKMCMPFGDFHKAVEGALGRPVYTHEFAYADDLRAEFLDDKPKPSMDDIMNLIPEDKRIVVRL